MTHICLDTKLHPVHQFSCNRVSFKFRLISQNQPTHQKKNMTNRCHSQVVFSPLVFISLLSLNTFSFSQFEFTKPLFECDVLIFATRLIRCGCKEGENVSERKTKNEKPFDLSYPHKQNGVLMWLDVDQKLVFIRRFASL